MDGLTLEGIADKLERLRPTLERRSQRTATAWLEALRRAGATVDEGGGGPHEPAAGS